MRPDRFRLSAVAIAAMLFATLVASPAIGGPSLKQWLKEKVGNEMEKQLGSKGTTKEIKRQVRKQLTRKTGPAGPTGAAGADGPAGADGGPGGTGGAIVARASLSGPAVSSSDQHVAVPIPLTDASWTQSGGEIDEVYVEATHTGMDADCFGGADSGSAGIQIALPGGQAIGMQIPADTPAGTIAPQPQPAVLMPSLAGAHTLTATVADSCVDSENTTVTGIDIYVVANM